MDGHKLVVLFLKNQPQHKEKIMINETLLHALKHGRNILLTGNAGTGKSYQTNLVTNYLKRVRVPYAVTASTGYASTHIKGSTIHSFLGLKTETDPSKAKRIYEEMKNTKRMIIAEKSFIIIDEISMISSYQLDLISEILKLIKNNQNPFGGVQMMLVGDFFQLPPVVKGKEVSTDNLWVFKSKDFLNGNFKTINLTEVKRQDDNEFIKILNEARIGKLSENSIAKLFSRQIKKYPNDCIRIYGTNNEVDNENDNYLASINQPIEEFKASIWIDESFDVTERGQIFYQIINSNPMKQELRLKESCRVMIRENNPNEGYVNGSTGTYIKECHVFDTIDTIKYEHMARDLINLGFKLDEDYFMPQLPSGLYRYIEIPKDKFEKIANALVHFPTEGKYNSIPESTKLKIELDNGKIVYVGIKIDNYNFNQKYDDMGEPIYDANFCQFPVTVAKAITSHKSQGCTLEKVFIDFWKINQAGQGYVALSRVKSFDGLYLKNFDSRKVRASKEVLNFYNKINGGLNE
jgi:ATP-dependent exoDNAse (exonuclease V) alpha subunit